MTGMLARRFSVDFVCHVIHFCVPLFILTSFSDQSMMVFGQKGMVPAALRQLVP
jgi:hypothetical protein